MFNRLVRSGWLAAIAVTLAITALAAACGGDDDPEPTPTTAPTPTEAPAPSVTQPAEAPAPSATPPTEAPAPSATPPTEAPAPSATPPTEAPAPSATPPTEASAPSATQPAEAPAPSATQPAERLATLVITQATTGKDIMDRISEAEQVCVREAFGDFIYQIVLGTPILLAGSDQSAAAPMFNCLEIENLVGFGIAFLSAQAGGWTAETTACMIGVGLEQPNVIMLGLGVPESNEASAAAAAHPYLLEFFDCMTAQEKLEYLLDFQEVLDSLTTAEHDLIGAIPEADAACIRDALSEDEYNTLLAGTVYEAFDVSDSVAGCMTDDGYVQAFVTITVTTIGELTDETKACLADFAREHPHYTALINAHAFDPATIAPADVAEIADDGLKTWECMTDEEIQRSQQISFSAMAR